MGRANASYLPLLESLLPSGTAIGKRALARLRQASELSGDARHALRRYSASHAPGCEDGKALNASLRRGERTHLDWATAMDASFVWEFDRDVLLWRGGHVAPGGESAECFLSTTLVERRARAFASRGRQPITAVLLPAGTAVSIPGMAWAASDDERTVGVVSREVEVVLPRGTALVDSVRLTVPGGATTPPIRFATALAPSCARAPSPGP